MITSRLTNRATTTIPRAVLNALELTEGDRLAWQIQCGKVILTKMDGALPVGDPFATFTEWDSEADRRAYGDLQVAEL